MTTQTNPPPDNATPDERRTITLRVSHVDWLFVKGCDADHGSISNTFRTYLTKLVHECKQRGITDFSRTDEFRSLVHNTAFVPDDSVVVTRAELESLRTELESLRGLRDSTATRSNRPANGRNESRRTPRKGHSHKTAKNSAGVQVGGGSGDTNVEGQGVGNTNG